MKAIAFICIAIGLLHAVRSEDDGKYRPELYGDQSGRYNPGYDGRYYNYNNYIGRNGYYNPNYAYQPQYYSSQYYNSKPYQELLAPLITAKASSVRPVAVTTTAAPIVVPTSNYVYTRNYGNEGYARNYGNEGYARIIEQENDLGDNSYQYKYRTENGISAGETGVFDTANQQGGTRVSGFYEYVGDDGVTYRVDYVADENGYRASGAHLPKA